jgi:D-amino peptidase
MSCSWHPNARFRWAGAYIDDPMNVYISVDMEGVAGVAHEDQTDPINPAHAVEYARFRRLMTNEANAAIQGALDAGAGRVLVNDSHWQMRNLLAEELHSGAELLSSGPKRLSMMEGVDGGFDAVFCIGYHAMAGTPYATIDHTYTDRIHQVTLNGRPVGELGINAAVAGVFGAPVALVSGDQALAAEARALLGTDVEAVVVKEARGRFSAKSLSPAEACRLIHEAAARTLGRKHVPFRLAEPITISVEFALTQHADQAELVPGSTRNGGRTISFTHRDYLEVFRAFRAMYNLAATA